jgi:membrane protein
VAAARQKFDASIGGSLWRRLAATDFINRGILLAAVQLLCLLPFLIITRTLTDQNSVADFIERFGLNHDAADAVRKALVPPASNSLTAPAYVLFVLSGFAVAGAVQELYEKTFDLPGRGLKDTPRRLIWLLVLTAATAFSGTAGSWLHDTGGPVLFGAVVLIGATGFWWLSMWLLLGGRLGWRELFPSAVATGVCWLGMTITFRLTMSDTVITDYRRYGSVGVIIAFMSYLIAIGVVIVLGAIVGLVWRERRNQPAAPGSLARSTPESTPPDTEPTQSSHPPGAAP